MALLFEQVKDKFLVAIGAFILAYFASEMTSPSKRDIISMIEKSTITKMDIVELIDAKALKEKDVARIVLENSPYAIDRERIREKFLDLYTLNSERKGEAKAILDDLSRARAKIVDEIGKMNVRLEGIDTLLNILLEKNKPAPSNYQMGE